MENECVFCFQVDHDCPSYQPPEDPMAQAAIKIQEITNRLDAADSKKGQGRKSDKLAAKVMTHTNSLLTSTVQYCKVRKGKMFKYSANVLLLFFKCGFLLLCKLY